MKLEILPTYNQPNGFLKAKLVGATLLNKEERSALLLYTVVNEATNNRQLVNVTIKSDYISGLSNKVYDEKFIKLHKDFSTDWFYIENNNWAYLNPLTTHSTKEIFN